MTCRIILFRSGGINDVNLKQHAKKGCTGETCTIAANPVNWEQYNWHCVWIETGPSRRIHSITYIQEVQNGLYSNGDTNAGCGAPNLVQFRVMLDDVVEVQ